MIKRVKTMKVISKEALVLGGLYSVLITPFYLVKNRYLEEIGFIIGILFILSLILLYNNKFSNYVSNKIKLHPNISYYLTAAGWVIYFMFAGIACIPEISTILNLQDNTLEIVMNVFSFICNWGIPVSLVIAFAKTRKAKSIN